MFTKSRSFPLFAALPIFPLSLALAPVAQAVDYFWNPAVLSNTWDTSTLNWASVSGGAPGAPAWVSGVGNNAYLDPAGTYTVNLAAAQTAGTLFVRNGTVTLSGSPLSSNTVNIANGASLTAASATYLKVGTTALVVNGTLNHSGGPGNTQIVTITGSGAISLGADFRIGAVNFSGNFTGTGGLLTQAAGTITLSGSNTYSGNTLVRNGNTLRLDSTGALSSNTFLRFGGGNNIVELAASNFSRTLGGAAGQVRFHNAADGGGNSGFAAVGADRTVAINGGPVWGGSAATFNPGIFQLGNANSSHKVTLTTGIDLNGAVRTITSVNGAAAVEGEISGNLTGTGASGIQKTGTGTLQLSGTNTYTGNTSVTAGRLLLSGTVNATADLSIAGGTVELGASERIQNTAGTSLSGGSLLTGGFSETLGVLTLSGSNVLDLGNATGGTSVVTFADSTAAVWAPGATLSILNWNGSLAGGVGGDQVIFTAAGLPSLAALSFVDPAGLPAGTYAAKLAGSEIVPVPEPAGLLLPAGLALLFRRRR